MIIDKQLTLFTYIGQELDIRQSSFKSKIEVIYKISDSGLGFISYSPSSSYPGFVSLVSGTSYYIQSKELPYDLPTEENTSENIININYEFNSNFFE